MGNLSCINAAIEKKLMDLHCAYIGRVVWTDGKTATVQPLGLYKEAGGEAKTQAVVSDVPVACKYKLGTKTIRYVGNSNGDMYSSTVASAERIAKGDLVVCLCADRNISEARHGNNELPPAGRHSISDSIIVGIL